MIPTYYMPEEKRAYQRGWQHGITGKPRGKSKLPNAYNKGYWEGVADKAQHEGETA